MPITIEAQLLITIGGIVIGGLATYYATIYGVKIGLAKFEARTEARLAAYEKKFEEIDERVVRLEAPYFNRRG